MKVTSINELKSYAKGTLVELPPFAEGQPFLARLKRPSMLALVKGGKIPNRLLTTANQLFVNPTNVVDVYKDDSMTELFEILDVICAACFVEPSYSQMQDAGVELTDNQLMFVFNYTQHGVKALESFRRQPESVIDNIHGEDVPDQAVGDI